MQNRCDRALRLMAALFLAGLVSLLCVGTNCAQRRQPEDVVGIAEVNPAAWKEFSSTNGRFVIQFPGAPKESTLRMGEVDWKEANLHAAFDYAVAYFDFPSQLESDKDPGLAQRVLDDALAGAVAQTKSKLVEAHQITLQNHPGRRFAERMADGSMLQGKIFVVGSRFYQITIQTPNETGIHPEAVKLYERTISKFLESFRFIGP